MSKLWYANVKIKKKKHFEYLKNSHAGVWVHAWSEGNRVDLKSHLLPPKCCISTVTFWTKYLIHVLT